ncbi:MAG: hypothetical protein DSM106950_04620 [Stigonema ocellatum SAG 48.90 = DSM 106950]|nr:hypothetical protein [Stigonema ocellatum SAG 48.90 = DSM 106950]
MTSQTQNSATSAAPAYSDVPSPVKELAELSAGALCDVEGILEELSDAESTAIVGGLNVRAGVSSPTPYGKLDQLLVQNLYGQLPGG